MPISNSQTMKLQPCEGEAHTAKFYTIHPRIAFFDGFPTSTCEPKSARVGDTCPLLAMAYNASPPGGRNANAR
jgi:hypothetical protein